MPSIHEDAEEQSADESASTDCCKHSAYNRSKSEPQLIHFDSSIDDFDYSFMPIYSQILHYCQE